MVTVSKGIRSALLQHTVVISVGRTGMDVQRSSALRGWSVWMWRHRVWGQCVNLALQATLEMERNALVSKHQLYTVDP